MKRGIKTNNCKLDSSKFDWKCKLFLIVLTFVLALGLLSIPFTHIISEKNKLIMYQEEVIHKQAEEIKNLEFMMAKAEEVKESMVSRDKIKETNDKWMNELLLQATDRKVNLEAYYIRNELLYRNKNLSLEEAAYQALWIWSQAKRASSEYNVDLHPFLSFAVFYQESDARHYKDDGTVITNSKSGAIGGYQLMPSTARQLGVNPYIFEENIIGGNSFLAEQLWRYKQNIELALGHYNGGSNPAYKIEHYPETKKYVEEVIRFYNIMKENYRLE